ncbi:MAG: ATP-binding protein, partial [Leptolyngbyaceae cyanobacterium SM1_4_3]|nr:ATP-binding protein [Leptolyngbyaceae cyanobacterium SM1_4_3]
MMTSTSELLGFSMLSRLAELRNAWEQDYSERAQGGLLALSGFEYQFLLTLLKIVHLWKASTDAERQDLETARKILAEAISDITESGRDITFTQVKRTLSASGLRSALEELWEIFQLASERTPDLAEHLRFVISGQFEGHENPQQVIQGWRTQSDGYSQQELRLFKARVRYDLVPDPRSDLSTELQVLARDENTETTIARWLGYLLQLGSGFSPESISTFIWKELANDGSVEAFRATLARLLSLSHSRLCVIRETLGDNITLPRAKLSDLRASLFKKNITLLIGSSGSGKSALCKAGIQQDFKQNFDCLFLHASDIASFTESSDVIANRGLRRLDELLIARITQKPTLVVIDDLSDVDDQHFDAVLNLLHNTLTADPLSDVRFILVAHVDARRRIHEKISARFGNDSVYDDVELPQLPVEELVCSEALPNSVISLIQRHQEFGPALNLKLIDWLVRSAQREQVDTAVFKSDLDLLTWFWHEHVQDSQESSNLSQVLIRIAKELADRFTPDLPRDFDPLLGEALHTLVRRDCLRIVSGRLVTTHRFVGDCARFYYLRGNRREIESEQLVEWLQNPFWVQPIRWFALQLALESSEGDTWQEFLYEALEGEHLQLLDLLLDGAILSKQPGSVLQGCPDENLPFVIERLITRLLAIATEPYPFHADGSQSTPLRTRIAIQEQITGIPKPDLWEPVWHWLLS